MNILKQIKNLASDSVKSSGPSEDWYIIAERAEGIKDVDRFSKSDPYLKIEFGGKSVKTRTINNDRSPAWNETFHFQLSSGNAKDIHLTLMDNDVGLDDTIGTATISKADLPLMSGEEKCLKVPVYRKEIISGLIHLRVKKISANPSIPPNPSSTYSQNQMSSNYSNTSQQQPPNFGSSNQYQSSNTSSNMPPPTYNQPYSQQSFNAPYNPQQGSYNPQQGPYQSQTGTMHQHPQQQQQQQPYMNMPQTNYPQPNNNYGDQYQQRRY